jgi:hypothetical protein
MAMVATSMPVNQVKKVSLQAIRYRVALHQSFITALIIMTLAIAL